MFYVFYVVGGSKMAEEEGQLQVQVVEMKMRRRSARIWALEEKKKYDKEQEQEESNHNDMIIKKECLPSNSESKSKQLQEHDHPHNHDHGPTKRAATTIFKHYDRKRGRKRKRLEDVAVVTSAANYPSPQEEENPKHENTSTRDDQRPISSSTQHMPERRILNFVLDILQRRDTHEIFSQPVDPEEAEGYYQIIKEPMDFGTMRAKLQEGMYTSLEQFEHDVFLISNNAMHFNSSATIYYREARGINELAQRVFHSLKTDLEKFELEFSLTRRRRGRKPQGEARASWTKLARIGRVNIGLPPKGRLCSLYGPSLKRITKTNQASVSSNHRVGQRDNEMPFGSREGFETARRQTYRPWTSFSSENESIVSSLYNAAPKSLIHINQGGTGYKESVMRFVKDLGPTAQMVANRKLAKCVQIEAPKCQSQTPTPWAKYTPSCLVPEPSLLQAPAAYLDGINNSQIMPQSFLPVESNFITYSNNPLDIHDDVSRGENIHTCNGINIDRRTGMTDSTFQPSSEIMGICSNLQGRNNREDIRSAFWREVAANTRENMDSSKGKMICTSDNMDFLHGDVQCYDITDHHNQNMLGSHSYLNGNANMYSPIGNSGITNMFNENTTMDMMAESNQLFSQVQLATESQSRLQELMSRTNNHSDSSFFSLQGANLLSQANTSWPGLGSQYEGGSNSALQAVQSQEWSRPTTWDRKAICDFSNLQMQLNNEKLLDLAQSRAMRQESHIAAAARGMALLHAMSFYEKATPTPQSNQAETSAQCFRDIQQQSLMDSQQQLDLALQL